MKHLILHDHNLSYLVYFRPKDKAKMYEAIYKAQQDFWSHNYGFELLDFITKKLNENGFKVANLSQEIKEMVNVCCDFSENSFFYGTTKIMENSYGFCFRLGNATHTCKTIEEAIAIIDKEGK